MTYYESNKETLEKCIKAKLNTEDFKQFYKTIKCPSEELLAPTISKKGHRSRCFYCLECKKYAYDKIEIKEKYIKIGRHKIKFEELEGK